MPNFPVSRCVVPLANGGRDDVKCSRHDLLAVPSMTAVYLAFPTPRCHLTGDTLTAWSWGRQRSPFWRSLTRGCRRSCMPTIQCLPAVRLWLRMAGDNCRWVRGGGERRHIWIVREEGMAAFSSLYETLVYQVRWPGACCNTVSSDQLHTTREGPTRHPSKLPLNLAAASAQRFTPPLPE
jgi:hypothetical protein